MSTAPSFSVSPIAVPGKNAAAEAMVAGWSGQDVVTAVAIMIAESGLNAAAISPPASDSSRGYGLMQIEWPTHANLFPNGQVNNLGWVVPSTNCKMGMTVYQEQGWHAWTTYFTGAYLAHLPEATMAVASLTQAAQAAKQDVSAYAAAVSKADTVSVSPILLEGGLGSAIQSTATTGFGEGLGSIGNAFTGMYQGYSGPEAGNPLLRLFEIFLGGVLLVVGLSKLTSPITSPITSAVGKAAKIVPV